MPLGRVYVPPPWSNQANQKLIDTNGNSDHYTPFKKIEIKIEKAPAPTESVVPIAIDRPSRLEDNHNNESKPEPEIINIPIKVETESNECNGNLGSDYLDDPNRNDNSTSIALESIETEVVNHHPEHNGVVIEEIIEDDDNEASMAIGTQKSSCHSLARSTKGLKNLGNTCYMNSIIQCLVHTRELLEFLQDFLLPEKPSSPEKNAKKITKALSRLAQDMWKSSSSSHCSGINNGVADPSSFRREISSFAPKFAGFEQHDSQEFLIYALDGIHTELNRIIKKSGKEDQSGLPLKGEQVTYQDIEEEGISHAEKSQRCLRFYLQKDSSIITDLFLGQFRSTLRCTHCSHESVTFEPFWVVSVPLSKDTIDLQECLELFVREETLDGDEMPSCDDCKDRRKSTKWYSFERWPEILVIHLKRFAPSGSYRAKLTSNIQVPLSQLDLSSFSSDPSVSHSAATYQCYGISNHSGTLHGGHYIAACRHPYNQDAWHMYNDRSVSGMTSDRVITPEAYLLFFQKVSPSS